VRQKNADYARRRDPRASLGRGVRPSPISQSEEAGGGSRSSLRPADDVLEGAKRLTGTVAKRLQNDAKRLTRPHNPLVPLILFLFALLGGAVAAIFAPMYLDLLRRELSRSDELEEIARGLGLPFSRTDPAYPGSTAFRYPFELFSRGIEQTCENFITGTIGAVDVVAFDFLYRLRLDADDAEGDMLSEPIRFSCALAAVAGERPHVVIEPASAPLAARADGEPVRLEWGDFNSRYRVISPDRGFAAAIG